MTRKIISINHQLQLSRQDYKLKSPPEKIFWESAPLDISELDEKTRQIIEEQQPLKFFQEIQVQILDDYKDTDKFISMQHNIKLRAAGLIDLLKKLAADPKEYLELKATLYLVQKQPLEEQKNFFIFFTDGIKGAQERGGAVGDCGGDSLLTAQYMIKTKLKSGQILNKQKVDSLYLVILEELDAINTACFDKIFSRYIDTAGTESRVYYRQYKKNFFETGWFPGMSTEDHHKVEAFKAETLSLLVQRLKKRFYEKTKPISFNETFFRQEWGEDQKFGSELVRTVLQKKLEALLALKISHDYKTIFENSAEFKAVLDGESLIEAGFQLKDDVIIKLLQSYDFIEAPPPNSYKARFYTQQLLKQINQQAIANIDQEVADTLLYIQSNPIQLQPNIDDESFYSDLELICTQLGEQNSASRMIRKFQQEFLWKALLQEQVTQEQKIIALNHLGNIFTQKKELTLEEVDFTLKLQASIPENSLATFSPVISLFIAKYTETQQEEYLTQVLKLAEQQENPELRQSLYLNIVENLAQKNYCQQAKDIIAFMNGNLDNPQIQKAYYALVKSYVRHQDKQTYLPLAINLTRELGLPMDQLFNQLKEAAPNTHDYHTLFLLNRLRTQYGEFFEEVGINLYNSGYEKELIELMASLDPYKIPPFLDQLLLVRAGHCIQELKENITASKQDNVPPNTNKMELEETKPVLNKDKFVTDIMLSLDLLKVTTNIEEKTKHFIKLCKLIPKLKNQLTKQDLALILSKMISFMKANQLSINALKVFSEHDPEYNFREYRLGIINYNLLTTTIFSFLKKIKVKLDLTLYQDLKAILANVQVDPQGDEKAEILSKKNQEEETLFLVNIINPEAFQDLTCIATINQTLAADFTNLKYNLLQNFFKKRTQSFPELLQLCSQQLDLIQDSDTKALLIMYLWQQKINTAQEYSELYQMTEKLVFNDLEQCSKTVEIHLSKTLADINSQVNFSIEMFICLVKQLASINNKTLNQHFNNSKARDLLIEKLFQKLDKNTTTELILEKSQQVNHFASRQTLIKLLFQNLKKQFKTNQASVQQEISKLFQLSYDTNDNELRILLLTEILCLYKFKNLTALMQVAEKITDPQDQALFVEIFSTAYTNQIKGDFKTKEATLEEISKLKELDPQLITLLAKQLDSYIFNYHLMEINKNSIKPEQLLANLEQLTQLILKNQHAGMLENLANYCFKVQLLQRTNWDVFIKILDKIVTLNSNLQDKQAKRRIAYAFNHFFVEELRLLQDQKNDKNLSAVIGLNLKHMA